MTPEEQEIMDHITSAFNGIMKLGLTYNTDQLAIGTHMMQQCLQQRVLYRADPETWSNWYE